MSVDHDTLTRAGTPKYCPTCLKPWGAYGCGHAPTPPPDDGTARGEREITCSKCGNKYTGGSHMTSSYCPRCYISNPTPQPNAVERAWSELIEQVILAAEKDDYILDFPLGRVSIRYGLRAERERWKPLVEAAEGLSDALRGIESIRYKPGRASIHYSTNCFRAALAAIREGEK